MSDDDIARYIKKNAQDEQTDLELAEMRLKKAKEAEAAAGDIPYSTGAERDANIAQARLNTQAARENYEQAKTNFDNSRDQAVADAEKGQDAAYESVGLAKPGSAESNNDSVEKKGIGDSIRNLFSKPGDTKTSHSNDEPAPDFKKNSGKEDFARSSPSPNMSADTAPKPK